MGDRETAAALFFLPSLLFRSLLYYIDTRMTILSMSKVKTREREREKNIALMKENINHINDCVYRDSRKWKRFLKKFTFPSFQKLYLPAHLFKDRNEMKQFV